MVSATGKQNARNLLLSLRIKNGTAINSPSVHKMLSKVCCGGQRHWSIEQGKKCQFQQQASNGSKE